MTTETCEKRISKAKTRSDDGLRPRSWSMIQWTRFFRPLPIPDEVILCIFAVSFAALPIPEDPLPILQKKLVEEKAHLIPF